MRSKWILATGVVLALFVVAAVGGVTVRAFAGVAVKTKTVTKFCVYVDRHNGGDSYGDVSVIPKYKNRVCIAGKPGDTSVITWNKTIAEPVSDAPKQFSGLGGLPSGTIELAKVGPFSVRGACVASDGVGAGTGLVSAQDGSSLVWDSNYDTGDFNSGEGHDVSNWAWGSAVDNPDFENEGTDGDFSVTTGDQKTAFTGFANNGVYLNGDDGPACSFTGYLVVQNPSPAAP